MSPPVWSVVVFGCKPSRTREILVESYDFMRDMSGVKDLHFIVRDRYKNQAVVSFRLLIDDKSRKAVSSKVSLKLKNLVGKDKFEIDPTPESQFYKYVGWNPETAVKERTVEKFNILVGVLSQLSSMFVEMARNGYFGSQERAEIAHVIPWMLGCTEYGKLSKEGIQVGYYDRIDNEYFPYLQMSFSKPT